VLAVVRICAAAGTPSAHPCGRISDAEIASYLARGTVLVAGEAGEIVGHVQMLEADAPATWELAGRRLPTEPARRWHPAARSGVARRHLVGGPRPQGPAQLRRDVVAQSA
jgi:hypothetical protein